MADSAAKTSDKFVGVDPIYATYTNDVDKPYGPGKVEDEANVPAHLRKGKKDEAEKDEPRKAPAKPAAKGS